MFKPKKKTIQEEKTIEFKKRFGFILKYDLDSKKKYYDILKYYLKKHR